jgi:hypothetical protein
MKLQRYILVTALLLLGSVIILPAQSRRAAREDRQAKDAARVEALVKERSLVMEVTQIFPMSGRSRNTQDGYTLSIFGDTLRCYLPFFGQMYQAPLRPDESGVVIKDKIVSISEKFSEKKGWDLVFEARSEAGEVFNFFLSIGPTGNCSLNVNGNHRQSISYQGILHKEPKRPQRQP